MTLKISDKEKIVSDLNSVISRSLSGIVVEYAGLDVAAMTEIRQTARDNQVFLKVVKNTLARRAIQGTEFACMDEAFKGPVFCAFSLQEVSGVGRVFKDLVTKYELLKIKGIALNGTLLSPESIDKVASLPTKEEAIALFMRLTKTPINNLAVALNDIPTRLVRVLSAVKTQKEAS